MTEQHECEWEIKGDLAICKEHPHCSMTLDLDEQERRLNEYETLKKATEELSAEDAGWCASVLIEATNTHGVGQKFNRNPYYLADVLQSYADTLEGKGE